MVAAGTVLARIVTPHAAGLDYHEWITFDERVRADRLGRLNPKVAVSCWVEWRCNNTDCPGLAYVSEENARFSLREAE